MGNNTDFTKPHRTPLNFATTSPNRYTVTPHVWLQWFPIHPPPHPLPLREVKTLHTLDAGSKFSPVEMVLSKFHQLFDHGWKTLTHQKRSLTGILLCLALACQPRVSHVWLLQILPDFDVLALLSFYVLFFLRSEKNKTVITWKKDHSLERETLETDVEDVVLGSELCHSTWKRTRKERERRRKGDEDEQNRKLISEKPRICHRTCVVTPLLFAVATVTLPPQLPIYLPLSSLPSTTGM